VEHGFSSPEELDAAISAAFAGVQDSTNRLKPIEAALREEGTTVAGERLSSHQARPGRPRRAENAQDPHRLPAGA